MSNEDYINKLRREYNIVNTLNQDRIDITRDEITTAPPSPSSPRSTKSTRSVKSTRSDRSTKSTRSDRSTKSTKSVKSDKSNKSNKSTKSVKSDRSNKSTRSVKSMRSTTESVKNILMGIENELEEVNYVNETNETNETSRTTTDNREVMNEREEDGVVDNLFNLDDIMENNTHNIHNTNNTNNTNNNTNITQSLVLEKEQEINDDLISDNDSIDSDSTDSDSTDSADSNVSMELYDELDYDESDFDENKRRMIVRKENKNPKILREKRQMILRLSRFKSRGRVGIPEFKLDRNTYREIKMIFDDEIADIKLTSDIEFYRFIIIAAIFIVEFITKKIKLDWFEGWCDKLLMNPSRFDISIENTISCNPKLYGDVNPVMKLFTEIAYDGLILAAGNCFKKILRKTNRKVEISPPDEAAIMLNARINSRSARSSF